MIKTSLKYTICKARMKISFSAYRRTMTVAELICDQILKSFTTLQKGGCLKIKKIDDYLVDHFDKILSGGVTDSLKAIAQVNLATASIKC